MQNNSQEKIELILVKKLNTEYKLQLEDGSWQRIKSIDSGFYSGSKLITYTNGHWSCLLNTDKVEAILCNIIE